MAFAIVHISFLFYIKMFIIMLSKWIMKRVIKDKDDWRRAYIPRPSGRANHGERNKWMARFSQRRRFFGVKTTPDLHFSWFDCLCLAECRVDWFPARLCKHLDQNAEDLIMKHLSTSMADSSKLVKQFTFSFRCTQPMWFDCS